MAPPPILAHNHQFFLSIPLLMSSPTTNVLATVLCSKRAHGPNLMSKMKTVHIKKDKHLISVMSLSPITKPAWQKKTCFNSLCLAINRLTNANHNVADIITAVSNELPISTSAALQEADHIASTVTSSITNLNNLFPNCFLSSTGKTVNVNVNDDLTNRPVDICFFCCRCLFQGSSIDPCITSVSTFSANFLLRLPSHSYNPTTGIINILDTPTIVQTQPTNTSSLSSVVQNLFKTPTQVDTASTTNNDPAHTPAPTASTNNILSLRMLLKFGSTASPSSTTKFGFYGPFDFLDSQEKFGDTFGANPVLLHAFPVSKSPVDVLASVQAFADKCCLDVFLAICELNYVSSLSTNIKFGVIAVCECITALRQQNGTPDDLFNNFLDMATSLPFNVNLWTLNLGSLYFAALCDDVHKAMTLDKTFTLPNISLQTTKALQIKALRTIRLSAVDHYTTLEDQKKELQDMLSSAMSQFCAPHHTTSAASIVTSPFQQPGHSFYNNNSSLAKSTFQRYKGPPSSLCPPPPTRKNPTTGLDHPWDEGTKYLSQFPIGFRGCFACEGVDHSNTSQCPLKANGQFSKQKFLLKLWAHEPWT